MAHPLALIAKDALPADCMALIKEYATDKRAPHPVALLVKRFKATWVDTCRGCFYGLRISKVRSYRWTVYKERGDGVFTRETLLGGKSEDVKTLETIYTDAASLRALRAHRRESS